LSTKIYSIALDRQNCTAESISARFCETVIFDEVSRLTFYRPPRMLSRLLNWFCYSRSVYIQLYGAYFWRKVKNVYFCNVVTMCYVWKCLW